MKIAVLSLISVFAGMPLVAGDGPRRVLETNQPRVERTVVTPRAATLNQAPNQVNGLFSDEVCDICVPGAQSIAESFVVSTSGAGFSLTQIVLWSGYFPGDAPPVVDDFDILIHSDSGGLPNTVMCSETGIVPTSRTATGTTIFGVSEYQITIDLATACALADGTYWIELFNNTGTGTDDFFWETGDLDAVNGVAGSVWSPTTPGSGWTIDSAQDLAVQLNGTVVPVELQSFSIE